MSPFYVDERVTVHHGDCLDVLREMPDASVDAVVTDPPYGLEFMGKDWDAPWNRGDDINADAAFTPDGMGKGFTALPSFTGSTNPKCLTCGGTRRGRRDGTAVRAVCACADGGRFPNIRAIEMRAFQQWCESWAAECLRVLKPGGHMLAFGGTRTWHRLTCAIEDAGFEIRDSIAWLYGSGFPKSLDVSKAIDRAAGAEREILGRKRYADGTATRDTAGVSSDIYSEFQGGGMDTVPATDAARQWQGWGTSLKPAFEPVVVARRPLTGTVAANVLAWGTGALNVDGCRIATGDSLGGGANKGMTSHTRHEGFARPWMDDDEAREAAAARSRENTVRAETLGRWPTNVALDGHTAAELDRQTGTLTSGKGNVRQASGADREGNTGAAYGAESRPAGSEMVSYGDSGGASRFFPVFRNTRPCMLSGCWNTSADTADAPSRTTPATTVDIAPGHATTKNGGSSVQAAASAVGLCDSCGTAIARSLAQTQPAPSVIRELGLPSTADYSERILTRSLALIAEDLVSSGTTSITTDWTTSLGCAADAINGYTTRASQRSVRRSGQHSPGANFPRWRYEAKAPTFERPRADDTAHPTVKPLDLMRWLVRLVCPPGGTVLDPFAGSGTTAEAAVIEGLRCITIERDASYLPLIVARLRKPIQLDLFGAGA